MTNFAVISNPEKAAKYPLVNDELYPDIAVLDAEIVKRYRQRSQLQLEWMYLLMQ